MEKTQRLGLRNVRKSLVTAIKFSADTQQTTMEKLIIQVLSERFGMLEQSVLRTQQEEEEKIS